ncbi:TnsA endonuclease N-terminal domain-containing protein [Rhodoferax sp. U11-2br]|uniref:TnsA endonuclease N-terminal domain-containing protein n=1 Tax=Rhodoferax sp. U11-2br TaxID=2838878 RepID=UPI001BE7A45F|nr:TnsA endonuclease N-terminal domain-containing protein [Rhodoferax sp. U11-2br]MBT3067959.1 TnsA endonuclease N-terminal domain-containing protein [Rhodoferax sp. U11-2br]
MRKLDRVVHTHSYIERAFLLVAEFMASFHDVQEQWPLPREVTLGAAESLGIRHPTYPVSRIPVVMTVDFLLTTVTPDGELIKVPWDCKREEDLKDPRILEKLSLHRAAAEHLKLKPSRLFTDRSVPKQVLRNIEWIRATLPLAGEPDWVHALYRSGPADMLQDLVSTAPKALVWDYCADYDARKGYEPTTALRIFGWLLWAHKLELNISGRDVAYQVVRVPSPSCIEVVA